MQPTQKYLKAVFLPASLLRTALGPEGPHCRRRMGVGEAIAERRGQRVRQVRGRDERARETVMTLSFECHHGAKDPR